MKTKKRPCATCGTPIRFCILRQCEKCIRLRRGL